MVADILDILKRLFLQKSCQKLIGFCFAHSCRDKFLCENIHCVFHYSAPPDLHLYYKRKVRPFPLKIVSLLLQFNAYFSHICGLFRGKGSHFLKFLFGGKDPDWNPPFSADEKSFRSVVRHDLVHLVFVHRHELRYINRRVLV